ncbi:hypothetical protein FRC17_002256 [Serendipita sp. 399]|nr:hypothetical protein FRC17_002256 [Serendipita sp. 399]
MRRLLVLTGYFVLLTWNIPLISADNNTATTTTGTTSSSSSSSSSASSFCPSPLSPLLLAKPAVTVEPTCSLSSRPIDPAPEFLSFEEWKSRQLAAARDAGTSREKDSHGSATTSQAATTQETNVVGDGFIMVDTRMDKESNEGRDGQPPQIVVDSHPVESHPNPTPRSHIPLIDRFNYASNECNARIQSSHKSAKSASSILSRKKDRYMLSPCHSNREKHFVVVELCEDIRIDTVQLANFEFFSGVFKDIRVSAAHTNTNDEKAWSIVGEYTAKNIRGIQSFHPQKELPSFYRYIRVDFMNYYGAEYYCPVSLLRVYGLTQMEEWKSDVWKAEWEASQASAAVSGISASQANSVPSNVGHSGADNELPTAVDEPGGDPVPGTTNNTEREVNDTKETTTAEVNNAPLETRQDSSTSVSPSSHEAHQSTKMEQSSTSSDKTTLTAAPGSQATDGHDVATNTDMGSTTHASTGAEGTNSVESTSSETVTKTSEGASSDGKTLQTVTKVVSTTIVLSSATPPASTGVVVSNGESIYRIIINRLANLEANQTLYARYVEEQGRMVNTRLERMEEDIGRLGAIVASQQRNVAKMIEKHKAEIEYAQEQLAAQVDHLSHEVMLEKRLSVAQLVLLMAVLVFMALTRGSRGEPIRLSRAVHRKLQSSGDWVSSWRRSRLLSSPDADAANVLLHDEDRTGSLPFHLEDPPAVRAKHSFDRRPRRSSSQRSRTFNELLSTPPRKSRNRTRSRQNSLHSRGHTPVRSLKSDMTLTNPSDYSPPSHLLKGKRSLPLGDSNLNIQEPAIGLTHRSSGSVLRPFGRSISLSEAKGLSNSLGVGGSTSNLVGAASQRRLAKTAHMHEPKNLKSRRNTVNEPGRNAAVTLLSPTIENPFSSIASTFPPTEADANDRPERRHDVFRSDGDVSDMNAGPPAVASQPVGVPFPTPNSNDAFELSGDEGMWEDEEDDDQEMSSSPVNRGNKARLASLKRSLLASSSPSGGQGRVRRLSRHERE